MQYLYWELVYVQKMIKGDLKHNWYSRNWTRWEETFIESGFGEGHLQRGWLGQSHVSRRQGQTIPGGYAASLTKDIIALRNITAVRICYVSL